MSFFKNLFGKIFGGEEKNKSPQGLLDYGDTLKHADVDATTIQGAVKATK